MTRHYFFLLISTKENRDNFSLIEKQQTMSRRIILTLVATSILLSEKEKKKVHYSAGRNLCGTERTIMLMKCFSLIVVYDIVLLFFSEKNHE